MIRLLLLLSIVLGSPPAQAQQEPLVADLSEHLVAITTGFTGQEVLLFGATDGPGDVAIVVRGPLATRDVRRKGRVAGVIWANQDLVTFDDVPSFYHVASNRPLAEFAPDRLRARFQIGAEHIRMRAQGEVAPDEETAFKEALVRLKTSEGLYTDGESQVTLLGNQLFRTQLFFPANVPTGTYFVEVYLFRNGVVASAEIVPLSISKVGVGAEIYSFAYDFSPLYGLLAIFVAAFAGWAAGEVFRKS